MSIIRPGGADSKTNNIASAPLLDNVNFILQCILIDVTTWFKDTPIK